MKYFLLLCLSATFSILSAQEMPRTVVGSAGTYFSDVNTGNLHWTLGEIAINYNENGNSLAEGFHQTYFDLVITAVYEVPELNLSLDIYPNPTVGRLTLEGDWQSGDRVRIMDVTGRPLIEQALAPEREDFQLDQYPAGTYLLTITRDMRPLKTFRVVKQ